jgi:hypothetical protein
LYSSTKDSLEIILGGRSWFEEDKMMAGMVSNLVNIGRKLLKTCSEGKIGGFDVNSSNVNWRSF